MPNDTEVEQEIARLVKLAHPQDQGKPTEILEQELRTTIHTSLIKAVEGLPISKEVLNPNPLSLGDVMISKDRVFTIINSIFKE